MAFGGPGKAIGELFDEDFANYIFKYSEYDGKAYVYLLFIMKSPKTFIIIIHKIKCLVIILICRALLLPPVGPIYLKAAVVQAKLFNLGFNWVGKGHQCSVLIYRKSFTR